MKRYDPTKDLEIEARRRAKISASMQGNTNNLLGNPLGPKAHREGCPCGWCHPDRNRPSMVGELNPAWKGGAIIPTRIGWKAARRAVWDRDKLCRACKLPPDSDRRFDVHHIIPRREGGTNDPENLVGLHHRCHMKVESGKMNIAV